MTKRLAFVVFLFFSISPVYCQINIEYWTNRAKTKLFHKEYLSAIEDFNTILLYKPDFDDVVFFRGLAKFYLNDNRGAIDDFSKALTMHPYGSNIYYSYFMYRGMAREKLDDLKEAMEDYNSAIDAWPYSSEEFLARGFLFIKFQKYDDAIADFTKALELDKKNSYAFVYLGLAKQFEKRYGEALTDYSKAIQMDRNNVEAYVRRGINHNFLKGYEKAIEDFDRAIQLDSLCTFAYFNRAFSKTSLEDIKGAIKDYDKVIDLDPENDLTYFDRADLKTKNNDIKGALDDYTKAIGINPGNVLSYFNRALLFEKTGNYHKAIDDYTFVIKINPLYSNAYNNRAIVRRKIRDEAGAMADQTTAAHLNANLPKLIENGTVDSANFTRMTEFKTGFRESTREERKAWMQNIALLPNFRICYGIADDSPLNKTTQQTNIVEINKLLPSNEKFSLTNGMDPVSKDSAESLLKILDKEFTSENHFLGLFAKAILENKIQEYTAAIGHYSEIIRDSPGFSLAYFNRANARYDLMNNKNSQSEFPEMGFRYNSSIPLKALSSKRVENQDYDDVIMDYTKCTLMDSKFPYAYYNLATLNIDSKNYGEALDNLSKAIENEPKFGEAYYNRGLTLIFVRKTEDGCRDLSKAGELGIHEAYLAIKKFCDK